MAGTQRQERVARAIGEVVAIELGRMKDPRIPMCSVVRIDLTPDLRRARVHISLMAEGRERAVAWKALTGALGYLRGHVGRELKLRFTPEIVLVPDRSIEEMIRIGDLVNGETAGGEDADGGGDTGRDPGSV